MPFCTFSADITVISICVLLLIAMKAKFRNIFDRVNDKRFLEV